MAILIRGNPEKNYNGGPYEDHGYIYIYIRDVPIDEWASDEYDKATYIKYGGLVEGKSLATGGTTILWKNGLEFSDCNTEPDVVKSEDALQK